MILSHTHKFIFFSSSKVGTTSMERALGHLQEGAEYEFAPPFCAAKHVPPMMLRSVLPSSIWDDYFKFVFVRNPWDWFVSQWFYNARLADPDDTVHRGRRQQVRHAIRGLARRSSRSASAPPEPPYSRPTRDSRLSARDVDTVFDVLRGFRGVPGRKGLYQSTWVYDMDDRMLVDYVGRFENLQTDFDNITQRLGLDVALPHLNRTEHADYRGYYSPEARDRVADLWAVDIANFGYTFDPSAGYPSAPTQGFSSPPDRDPARTQELGRASSS